MEKSSPEGELIKRQPLFNDLPEKLAFHFETDIIMSVDMSPFLWIAVLGGICGFGYGFFIGANDVANAFASSVSSKSVTLKQAVIIASIFEFSGAFFLGASVTGTIRSKIIDINLYIDEPELLMFGMFTSLLSAVIMLAIATRFGLPVSTTHDIVGCIMGFSIAAKGFDSVDWDVARKLFMSWVASPLISGCVAAFLFGMVKYFVMKTDNPYQRAYYTFPIVLTIGLGIDIFYILYKASSNFSGFSDKLELYWVLPTSFGIGLFAGILWIFVFGPCAKKRVEHLKITRDEAEHEATTCDPESTPGSIAEDRKASNSREEIHDLDDSGHPMKESTDEPSSEEKSPSTIVDNLKLLSKKFGDSTYNQDLHAQSMHENPRTAEIWEQGEVYDPDAEMLFSYVQVFTACLNSFAHGANDVSNTIAPLSAIIQLYQDGVVEKKSEVQKWVLAYGGIAIVLGLALYGYRVMKSVGYKLTRLSPSRGASAELAASLTVVTASFLSIPVSSTQCIVGAVSGVGLIGGWKNVQWLFLARVCVGWVVLFFVAVLLSAGVFSFGAFSPSA